MILSHCRLAAIFVAAMLLPLAAPCAAEWHVAVTGKDTQRGTKDAPLQTIQRAADLAHPGDTVTVHAGVYRERVNPPRGGAADTKRIFYQAFGNPDGTPLRIDTDYFGRKRNERNPFPGPFEIPEDEKQTLKVGKRIKISQ
jgi:hypothetical protein